MFEPTELFVRSVGETTDIVHKEMYTFQDRKGRSLTLRPEGTAGVARAWIENRLQDRSHPLRLYYIGPMFRYERMQRGRYRQFSQIGLEIIGAETPLADAELLAVLHEFLARLGFDDLEIHLNNLGDPEDRPRYQEAMRDGAGAAPRRAVRRLPAAPRREPAARARLQGAALPGARGRRCRRWTRSPRGARGSTWRRRGAARSGSACRSCATRGWCAASTTTCAPSSRWCRRSSAPTTVLCGGGRYDRLISDLGGPAVPGVGFAIGEDRLVDVLPAAFRSESLARPRLYLVPLGDAAQDRALALARDWVRGGVPVEVELDGRSRRAALKRADGRLPRGGDPRRRRARRGLVTVKLLAEGTQSQMEPARLPDWWREHVR